MAETPKTEDMQDVMQKQIAELRREMSRINKTLAERAEEAGGLVEAASEKASSAARQLRTGAQSVTETVQQNPGTVSGALVLGGVVGFMLGMLMGSGSLSDRRWHY